MHALQRRSLMLSGVVLIAIPSRLFAQSSPSKVRRIGYLSAEPESQGNKGFSDVLQEFGYKEGENLVIEWRWGNRNSETLMAHAADLVDRRVELIVGFANGETKAVMRATRTIPIVMLWSGSPVEDGLVKSLARPEGNVTGTTYFEPEMLVRSFHLLREVRPSMRRTAVLWSSSAEYITYRLGMEQVDRLASSLGVQLEYFEVTKTEELPSVLKRISESRADALFFMQAPVFYYRAPEITAMALERKLPSIGSVPFWIDRGGLLAYTPDTAKILRRAASFVDRILRGAKPAELPIEQPDRYLLGVNMKTAKAIGVDVPKAVLLQAERIIE